jgi:hypothetical protein
MNTYLLLRDNKQTGPYTAQQLAEKGLKPYDLVWHEGRSAAWRYPSELEELKAFAPVVEEQPYDRFYKKPGEQAQQSSATVQTQAAQTVAEVSTVQESQPVSKQVEQTAAKHIYVTMPGGKTPVANTTTPVAKKEEAAKPVVPQNDKSANSATAKNTEKKAAASSYLISEEDDELNSGMLKGYQTRKKEDDEINNSYLSEYESRKAALSGKKSGGSAIKQSTEKPVAAVKETRAKEIWSTSKKDRFDLKALLAGSGKYLQDNKNVTRGLVAAVLILGGVVIGLVINSGHKQPDTKVLESLVKEIREQQNEKAGTTEPATETVQKNNEPQEEERKQERISNENANNSIADPAPSVVHNDPNQPAIRHTVIKKENNVVTPPPTQQQSKSIAVSISNTTQPEETTQAVVEPREKPINQEMLEKARRNINEQVHVEASAFKTGLFGGISDLDLTIQNRSLYPLDQVAVEIKYFGPEKKLVKTQTIIFNNVPPGKRRTLEVPPTNRGIAIDYTITSINSKALGMAQAGF